MNVKGMSQRYLEEFRAQGEISRLNMARRLDLAKMEAGTEQSRRGENQKEEDKRVQATDRS